LARSAEQPIHTPWKHNRWFEENWNTVETKNICLAAGQEGTLRIKLGKSQILSYKYLQESIHNSPTSHIPMLYKKGEMQVFASVTGGIAPYGATQGAAASTWVAHIEPVRVLMVLNHKFTAKRLQQAEGAKARRIQSLPAPGTLQADLDNQQLD
jgi:hypothetical protein